MNDKRPNNQLGLAFWEESRSEAPRVSGEGTESFAAKRGTESPAIGEPWMEEVCGRENCKQASKINGSVVAQPAEPPDADPHVRWCGSGGAARLPPSRFR